MISGNLIYIPEEPMRKYALIAIVAFGLGILTAGYVLLNKTEDQAGPPAVALSPTEAAEGTALNTSLFASTSQISQSLDFVSISEKVGPSVIRIVATRKQRISPFGMDEGWPFEDFWDRFFGTPQPRQREQVQTVYGTGFFISSDGYVLTNNHIIEDSENVDIVMAQGDEYQAEIKGRDPRTDIALLKVDIKNASPAELGDSAQLKVGEWVLAIGNPYGLEHTVTAGIVSAKGRRIGEASSYQDFIQTDAAINRGNSGGPLINLRGEVIGITSNIFTPTGGNIGIGFAIPSNIAMKVVEQLKTKGRVARGHLGILVADISKGLEKQLKLPSRKGAVISSVDPDSPAEKAGLKQYDVIVAIDGRSVEDMNDARFKIADIEPGKKAELQIIRDGQKITKTAVVDELDPELEKGEALSRDKDIGLTIVPLTPSLARRYGLKTTEGLLITEVVPGSEAGKKSLEPGMIIIEANRKKVTTLREFENILKDTQPGDEVILLVRVEDERGFQDIIIPVKVR